MDALIKIVDKSVEYVCKFSLVVQLTVVSGVVFGRFVLNYTPAWGEEMALFAMVWFGLLSASTAVRDDSHLSLTFLDEKLPRRVKRLRDIVVLILIALFGLFFVVEGFNLVELTRNNSLPGMGISSSLLYAAIPVSGVAIIVQVIARARDCYGNK